MARGSGSRRRIRGSCPEVRGSARRLRRSPTEAESILWTAIRRRQVAGLYFRRQHPLGGTIVDFCCTELRLIIEVDGPVHDSRQDDDIARDDHMATYGYHVLRVNNEDVVLRLPWVLRRIHDFARTMQ